MCNIVAISTLFALFLFFLGAAIWSIIKAIKLNNLFKPGDRDCRVCKKCGAIQKQYQPYYQEDFEPHTWWVEIFSGNNIKCKCHTYI